MPNLDRLVGRNLPSLMTYTMVGSGDPVEHYVNALARMTDRAAYAYGHARHYLSAAAAEDRPNTIPIPQVIRGVDYLEYALDALLRAQMVASRLRRAEGGPLIGRSELLSDSDFARIRAMRRRLAGSPR